MILFGTPLISSVGALASGSVILKSARLSVPLAPPSRPVPELAFSVPRPMITVSPPASVVLSLAALSVSVTVVAVAPVLGPVKVTVGVPESRFAQVTPVGSVVGHAVV